MNTIKAIGRFFKAQIIETLRSIRDWMLEIPTVGARRCLMFFAWTVVVLGILYTCFNWEEVKDTLPLLLKLVGKILILCASSVIVCLFVWKKTRGFFWNCLWIVVIGAMLLTWVLPWFLNKLSVSADKAPSLQQLVQPHTAWFGDKLNDAADRTASTTPSSKPTTPTSPAANSGGATKAITLLRGHQYYLTCKTGDGSTAHHSVWMEDTPEWRFQVNSIRGFKPVTTAEVAALFKGADDIRDVGKVGTPRPVAEIQQIQEDGGGGDTSPTFDVPAGPNTDLLPPVDGLSPAAEAEETPPPSDLSKSV